MNREENAGRPRYVLQVLPRPVIDCQFIGAAYDEWSTDRGWTDRIVVEENLLQAWLTLVERYFRDAKRPFSLDMRTMSRDDDPPGYASFREAVVNQLIHQDYGDHGRMPFVRFYRDRTVFRNPGDGNAPTGGLLDRTAKEVRNPLIAAAFRGIGLARQAGHGNRRHLQGLVRTRAPRSGDSQRRDPKRVRAFAGGGGGEGHWVAGGGGSGWWGEWWRWRRPSGFVARGHGQ